MVELPELDRPSTIITGSQARDFANRILGGIANRLAGGEMWTRIHFSSEVDDGDERQQLKFEAEWDGDESIYTISQTQIQALDQVEDPELVRQLLVQHSQQEEKTVEPLASSSLLDGEADEETSLPGFLAVEHAYLFRIPYRLTGVRTGKGLTLSVLDEASEQMASDIVYSWGLQEETPPEDLEHLVHYGEAVMDSEARGAELTIMTVADLELILKAFQIRGLVRPTARVLSSRARLLA